MILLNKIVEMEHIFTINVNIKYIDANQNFVNEGHTTDPFQVEQNDQRTMLTLFESLLGRCMQSGLKLIKLHILIYYDHLPAFAIIPDADMNLTV